MPRLQRGGRCADQKPDGGADNSPNRGDTMYFESYANTGIHEEMIKVSDNGIW
jgi:hypothetical protein